MSGYVLGLGLLCAAVTAAIGLYFTWTQGWGIVPLGVAGLAIAVFYTPWLTRTSLPCLVAPGLGFGTCMVMGADFVLGGGYSLAGFAASMMSRVCIERETSERMTSAGLVSGLNISRHSGWFNVIATPMAMITRKASSKPVEVR